MAEYSTSQMDNFYTTLGQGAVKPSAVMNYIQHLFIAERIAKLPAQSVLDVCCGRGLLVPLLARYSPTVSEYTGLDISPENLNEGRALVASHGVPPFRCHFVEGDVTELSRVLPRQFDVIAYTSAIEHLPQDRGITSLHEVAAALASGGTLYLSTPRTPKSAGGKLQYKVHVYEWDQPEMEATLDRCGLQVRECIGLLPPKSDVLAFEIGAEYGDEAVRWYQAMRAVVPPAFLEPVIASAMPRVAIELMYVCTHNGRRSDGQRISDKP